MSKVFKPLRLFNDDLIKKASQLRRERSEKSLYPVKGPFCVYDPEGQGYLGKLQLSLFINLLLTNVSCNCSKTGSSSTCFSVDSLASLLV